ncbi:MAG: UvrD-helicase domain-containing protein [Spirochaetia bacterium]|nr:UvrD-helicase domain-containing protein [Spirochaetia bacterium]
MNLKAELNDKQYEAASLTEGPLLIIAGAGSGKTRMITYRIAHLLDLGISEKNILALTFTNKAAAEMADRVRKLTELPLQHLRTSTFHAFGLGLLKQFIQHLGWKNNFTIYDTNDRTALIRQVIIGRGGDLSLFDLREIGQMISDIKTGRITQAISSNMQGLYDEYEKHLKAFNAVDFDDLITKPIDLFTQFPDILAKVQDRYQYILVDEFQDTSLCQYKFVKLIAQRNRNLCVVGDDDQSIYSWRGANFQNIVLFEQDFPERRQIMLERNYRSTGTILEAANTLIAKNTQRKQKKLWTKSGMGSNIYLIHPTDGDQEAMVIVRRIIEQQKRENIPLGNFAILVRTNALIPRFETALMERDIPCLVSGGQSFFDRKEIRDIVSYLKVIANPDDDVNFLRIINTPRRGIGRVTVEKIRSVAENNHISLYSALALMANSTDPRLRESTKKSLSKFYTLIETFSDRFEHEEGQRNMVLRNMINEINYRDFLIEDENSEAAVKYKMKGIELLCTMLARWERNPLNENRSMFDWINRICLIGKDDGTEDSSAKLNLMTMHAAKGLEWDTVYLAGIEDHIIPNARSLEEDPRNLEEERRLFYVAITRAKRILVISTCENRKRGNEMVPSQPSRFLEEIPVALFNEEDPNRIIGTEEAKAQFNDLIARLSKHKAKEQHNE